MNKIEELAIKCGVSRQTVMNVAERIHELEGGGTEWRYPTEEEVRNRHQFYRKCGRPRKIIFKE